MSGGGEVVLVLFPRGYDSVVVNNPKFYGHSVTILTAIKDVPVPNICSSCRAQYYNVLNVHTTSIGTSAIKLCKCPHSENVASYVKVI